MDTPFTATGLGATTVTAPPAGMSFRDTSAHALIRVKLAALERQLVVTAPCGSAGIDRMGHYLVKGGGKRFRPSLLLLVSQILDCDADDRDVRYAAIIEMLHMATLVHDDVIDGSRLRHGRASMNARWGNTRSVLFGDLLFTESLDRAIGEGDLVILKLLTDAAKSLVVGEMLELEHAGSLSLTPEVALDIIRRKTADLFGAASVLPAYLDRALTGQFIEPLLAFGRGIGTAFQLIDDLLDYVADERQLGKPVLNDLCEGKLTMPLVLAMARATPAERDRIATVLRERAFENVPPDDILEIAETYEGIAGTRRMAAAYTEQARLALAPLPECAAKVALLHATETLCLRTQ